MFGLKWLRAQNDLSGFDGSLQVLVGCTFLGFVLYSLLDEPCFNLAKPTIKFVESCLERYTSKQKASEQCDQENNENVSNVSLEINHITPLLSKS